MDASLYAQWAHLLPESSQHVRPQHDSRQSPTTLVDDWSKDRSNTVQHVPASTQSGGMVSAGSPTLPPPSQSSLDLSDFAALGDITGPSSNNGILSPSSSFYSPFANNYFMPYSNLAYAWPTQSHVPLSNYSTLNGATTSSTSSTIPTSQSQPQSQQSQVQITQQQQSDLQQQHQLQQSPPPQQQQHQSGSQQMMIDPALTTLTMNGSSTSSTQHQFPTSNYSTQSSQPQTTQFPFTQHINPYATSYYRQPQNPPSQGTMSPQALLSPSMMTAIHPSAFYSQPPASSSSTASSSAASLVATTSTPQPQLQLQYQGPSPQERKQQFENSLRPLLQSSAFTGAGAVQVLVDRISDYGSQEVDVPMRLEILTKIRDGAGNHYFRAWSENPTAIDITREWLKAAAKDKSQSVETIMPLLHIIDRLPLSVDVLTSSKLGKIVVHLEKKAPSAAIKDMAANLERRWRSMISPDGSSKSSENNSAEDPKSKKRKASDAVTTKMAIPPPPKKPAVGTTTSTKPVAVKKEVKSVPVVKDAKTDTSFFSAPKAKAKMPSFKKSSTTTQAKKEEPNVAQPSSIDPFQEALKMMKARKDASPAVQTPPPISVTTNTTPQPMASTSSATTTAGFGKNGKKKKSVTWAPDEVLESIRLIEKAIYDDDPVDGTHVTHNLRDLDRGEGAALHAHLFEEVLDWLDPLLIEMPIDLDNRPRGDLSAEKTTQEQREQTALGALYMSPAHIPDSPAEPSAIMPEEEVDKDVTMMTVGEEVDAVFWHGEPPPPPEASNSISVADLVGQLAVGMDVTMNGSPAFSGPVMDLQSTGLDANATLAAVQLLPADQLQQLLQQLSAVAQPAMQTQYGQISYSDDHQQAWASTNHNLAEYGQGYHDDPDHSRQWSTEGRGRGRGRGRSRGGRPAGDDGYRHNKRKPCSFFAAGRCKYGDQCDYAHEIS